MKNTEINAKAKINLFLEVTGKSESGYHTISTVMHEIGLCDRIRLNEAPKGKIILTSNSEKMPPDERNIAYRAAAAFFKEANIKDCGVAIDIQKHIPMEAGLAGGSTDGAAVIKGLNELYSNPLTLDELCSVGARIGADLPFCIKGGSMLCTGIGEKMEPCAMLPDSVILVAKGESGMSTPTAYRQLDETENREIRANNMPRLLAQGRIDEICNGLYNCFEVLVPSVEPIKTRMLENGALGSIMSGSGTAVFGIFDNLKDAKKTESILLDEGYFAKVCADE